MNVLKRLIIPRMHLTIAYILSELEELEREDTFRLKRVKEKKMKKAKIDGAGENIENIELNEEENTKLEETIEPDETAEPEKSDKPDRTNKLVTESVLDGKAVQPKEAAEMGDLIVLKPPDDRMELGDVFLPPPGLKTMATITEVEELIEGISEIKKGMKNLKALKEKQSDDEKIQLVDDDIINDVENMETGEWFESPSKLENMALLNEELSLYSKIEKLKNVISGVIEAETTSEVKIPLKADESIIDIDKRALTSLYKGIDSNFYQPTVEDIFSKHDLAMQDSVSQDISILDHSLVDLESIDFSIDSKGKVVVSKHNIVESSPVISTREAEVLKTSNDKNTQLVAPTGRIASVKWINESKTEEEELLSQFEYKIDSKPADQNDKHDNPEPTAEIIDEKIVKNISEYPKLKILEDAEESERTADTSAVEMPMKPNESIMDLDKRALASLYKGIDSNFYQTTVDDIFSKHDIAIQDSLSKDVAILDNSLVDLNSIDFSIDSKGKVIISKRDSDQPSPLSTRESNVSKQMASYSKDGKFVSPTGRIASMKWDGEGQYGEELGSQMENEIDGKLSDENKEPNNMEPTRENIYEKAVENLNDMHKLQNVVGRETDTSVDKMSLEADDSIFDIDKRALASLYRGIDSNFYKPTVDDIFSKHDLAIQDSNSLQDVSMLDHSLVDLESIDFSIDSKGKVVVSKHGDNQPSLLLTQGAGVSKQRESNDKVGKFVAPTGRISSVKLLGESRKEGEGLGSLLKHAVDDKLAENIIRAYDLKSTGQVGEMALDDVKNRIISVTKGDTVSNDVIKMNKHKDSLENEILTVDLKANDKDLEIQSDVSREEKEVWTSNTKEIPKNPISGKLTTETLNQKSLRSKISRSVSDENLARISEEDYVEQDTSKLDTLVDELKEIKIKEKHETEGLVIFDRFEDCKTSFHDSEKSSVNYEEISQQHDLKKDVEKTAKIKHIESKVFKETENLNNVQSSLKVTNEHFTQVQPTRSNSYGQQDKAINEMSNKSTHDMNKYRKVDGLADTSKINQKHESVARIENVVNNFERDNLKTNFEQSNPIETIESVNQPSFNSENERNRFVTYPHYENTDKNKNNIQETAKQGQTLNEISIPESSPENNVDGILKENNDTKRESYDLKVRKETQASEENIEKLTHIHQTISNIGENKPLQTNDLEHTLKVTEHQRDGNSSWKTEVGKRPSHDKPQKLKDSIEHVRERENRSSETVEQTGRINRDMHTSNTKALSVKEVVNKVKKDDTFGGMISTNSENKINSNNNESAEQSKINSRSITEIYSKNNTDDAGLKEAGREDIEHHKSLKVYSREILDSSSYIENTKRESQYYQENKIKSRDSQGKEGLQKELDTDKIHENPFKLQSSSEIIKREQDNERVSKDSKSKESFNKPLKIHSHELHESKRDSSNIENIKRDGQYYQENKRTSKDSKEDSSNKPSKIHSHESHERKRDSRNIENTKRDSLNYQEDKRISKDSKEDSSNKPLKIHSHELHERKRDSSNIENTKRDSQNYQEDKRISKDSQNKEGMQKELDKNKIHEKPLQLQNSSEIFKNEQDYEIVSKDSPSKEDSQSEKGSRIKEVSDSDGDQKGSQQSETESRSSNIPVLLERCHLCGTYHKKQD